MTKKIEVHVDSLTNMGQRFVDAWHRAEAGESFSEQHVTFLEFDMLVRTLSPRRIELVRYVRRHPGLTVQELSNALQRNYKNVHGDVADLKETGLLKAHGRKLSAPWAEVDARVML